MHYADLLAGLETQMRRLAGLLEMTVPDQAWPALVQAATFEQMRAGAEKIAGGGGTTLIAR